MAFGIDPLDLPDDPVPQDRNPVAAAQRVSAELAIEEAINQAAQHASNEARNHRDRSAADIDEQRANMRDAALLNALAVAKAHGMSAEWTETDIARWRIMRAMTDEIASGANESETVPQGFGPAVRARQTEAMLRAMAKGAKSTNGEAGGDA